MLAKYVPAAWDARKLGSFIRDDMTKFHVNLGRETGKSTANHVMRLLRSMFNLARDWDMLKGDNPATRIKLYGEKKRERYLSADEILRLNAALADEPNIYWEPISHSRI